MQTKIDEAAHAVIGPLAQNYKDEINDVQAVHQIDQAQNYLDNGATDTEVAATWWLLHRGHLHADQA